MTAYRFVTFKRWILNEGRQESELTGIVRDAIKPHYAKLPGCTGLGLLRIRDTRQYITLQYWTNFDTYETTTKSDDYKSWYQEYRPILERWHEIASFEDEWDCEDIGGIGEDAFAGI